MAENLVKVVLDTNILVSALIFGGKPEKIVKLALQKEIYAVTSPTLIAELVETLTKKFYFSSEKTHSIERKLRKSFKIVNPSKEINVLKDHDDNRVLEAGVEGKCDYIVTGDKELLGIGSYRRIKIVTSGQFLTILNHV